MPDSTRPHYSELERIFPGDSEMARLMRGFDWSSTRLGPPGYWPENLRVAVRLCLTSRFPILLWWGPTLDLLYNDAYLPWLSGTKHPRALARPGRECWSEIWETIGPMLEGVMRSGQATWSVDMELFFDRKVRKEEVYITYTYAPILAADGETVDGIFCPCFETTEKVIGARRLETLRRLGNRGTESKSVDAACQDAAAVLAENKRDIPFAAIYAVEETGSDAKLSAVVLPEGEHRLPKFVSVSEGYSHSLWPLASAFRTKRSVECPDLGALGVVLSGGPWPEHCRQALIVPIFAAQDCLTGLLVVGVNTRRPLDAAYRTFFDLVAGHIATAVADAQAYEAERRRAESLAELDQAKTAFFSNVSHEFRTPLTLILGPLESLLEKSRESMTMKDRDQLTVVHRNSLRLLKLVNTLLDFSRIEAGRVQACYEPTELAALVAELASNFRSAVDQAGLNLIIDAPPLKKRVYIDRGMWEKVVFNLLSNAVKFTFKGEIELKVREVGGSVEMVVRDTGTGISEEELPHLFERFYRVKGAQARTHEGTGIGLALVQELVKLHGGSVRVESVRGQGSRFIVSIPTGQAHLPADCIESGRTLASTALGAKPYVEEVLRWLPNSVSQGAPVGAEFNLEERSVSVTPEAKSPSGPRPRILWADDNADMRDYVRRLLSKHYDVEAVADGQAALEAARAARPDLILTDLMMPRMDGFELVRTLRQEPSTSAVPIIILSARAGEEACVEGMEIGADDYLIKPFSAREVLARVAAHIGLARARNNLAARELAVQQREAELARARLESVLHSMSDGFLVMDREQRITYVNPRGADLLSRSREELIGSTVLEQFSDIMGEIIDLKLHRSFEARRPLQVEVYDKARQQWFENHFYPSSEGLTVFFRNITERKRVEEQIRFQASLLDQVRNGVIAVDLEQKVVFWNRFAEILYQWTKEEALGRNVLELIVSDTDRKTAEKVLASLRKTGQWEGEFIVRRRDGSFFPAYFHNTAVLGKDGEVIGFVGVITDITERKRAEKEMADYNRRLQLLSGRLLVAHETERGRIARELHDEIGQCLTVIIFQLEAAKRDPDAAMSRLKECIDITKNALEAVRKLSLNLHPPQIDELGLIAALRWHLDRQKQTSNLIIDFLADPLPARLHPNVEIACFRVVQEALTNVLRHAQATRVSVELYKNGTELNLTISDNGRGFDAGAAGDWAVNGASLGLVGMRERTELAGGRMVLKSSPGQGTQVHAVFPVT